MKLDAAAVPPLMLTTCLITISFGAMSSFVTVQVFVSPTLIEPEQPAERLELYSVGPDSVTE